MVVLHARISHAAGGAWLLCDAGSGTGTFMLVPDLGCAVDAGSVVRVGHSEVTLFMQGVSREQLAEESAN